MASVRKRNGKFQAQIRHSGIPPITKTFQTKTDALTWSRQIESSLDRGDWGRIKTRQYTLKDLILRYRSEITPTKKQAQQEQYRLKWLLDHSISKVRLDRLGPQHISQYRDERLAKIRVQSSDGSQAVRHDLNLLSNIFTVAAKEWGISVENFVHSVRKPNPAKSRERRTTDIEVERLQESAPPLLRSMIELALETGLRRGEIHRLHGSDMDLKNRLLHIPVTKNGLPRTIPLSLKAADILSTCSPELPFKMTEAQFRYRWNALLKKAQIKDLHFHDLRHEAISRFFEMGLSVPEVALISGHRDPRMLFRYTHLRAEDVVKKLK